MLKVCVVGAAGRMGRHLVSNISSSEVMTLSGAVDRNDSPFLGQDAGALAGVAPTGVGISADLDFALAHSDAMINFATANVVDSARLAMKYGCSIVIGSTILTAEEQDELKELATNGARIVVAKNMSVGVNLLFKLVGEAAKALGEDYEVEIVEMHHDQKIDAPSGTAVRLAEIVCEGRKWSYANDVKHGRCGVIGKRPKREIGMHSLRGGDVVGDHTVIFAINGERIELTHKAASRDSFARGALRAVEFLADAAPGMYDMQDVLKLK